MPPKKKPPPTSSSKETCCVCCQDITISTDESLFCAGACQQWLHRYCASVSVKCYKEFKKNGNLFFCFSCSHDQSKREISMLKDTVEELKRELAELRESLSAAQSGSTASTATDGLQAYSTQQPLQRKVATTEEPVQRNYAAVAESSGESVSPKQKKQEPNSDKKFNIVIYGINECPKGMSRSARLESDLAKVVSVVSGINSSVQSQAIKDCFRLGRFNPQRLQPRPILVKFVRIADVSSILSNRGVLRPPIRIKPDMSPEERLRDSALLKERWSLIQSGVSRNDIKIRKAHLYVKNKIYGQYKNSKFVHSISPTPNPAETSPGQSSIVPSGDSDTVCQLLSSPTSPVSTIVPTNLLNSSIHEQSPSDPPPSNCDSLCMSTGPHTSD